MSDDIHDYENKKLLQQLNNTIAKEKTEQDDDVECVPTKIWLWEGDSYEEFDSDYLNQIFPYKLNKKTMAQGAQFIFHFLSSSLHYWIELMVQEGQSQAQRLGKKDVKVIEEILQTDQSDNWIAFRRWGQKFSKQQQFLKYEQEEVNYHPPKGDEIHSYKRGEDEFVIVEYKGNDKQFSEYKQRMEVLLLFYIDGVSFIFEEIDTWIYYLIFKKVKDSDRRIFVGMLSKYIFRLSTVKQRHRISQVFILPSYQKSGHGKELIDMVYDISLKDQKCFEITTEIPSFEYQCLRDFKELQMIIKEKLIDVCWMKTVKTKKEVQENREMLLKKELVRSIKQKLKIPGHQIERLINILIYHKIKASKDEMAQAYFEQDLRQKIILNRSPFKTRKRLPHLTLFGQVHNLKDFMLQKAKQDFLRNQDEVQQILQQTTNGFNRVILKMIKTKLLDDI